MARVKPPDMLASREPQAVPRERYSELTAYHIRLLVFVAIAHMLDAYDVALINLTLPYLANESHATTRSVGVALGLIGAGPIGGVVWVILADRFGRRRMLLSVVFAASLYTVSSAFTRTIWSYVIT
jgi:MFS family permease